MLRYVAHRLVQAGVVLVLASVVVFLVIRLIPGDPAALLAGPDASREVVAAVRQDLGLDETLPVQYVVWLSRVAQGDLGRSFSNRQSVLPLIAARVPASAELAVAALLVALVAALPTGILAALRPGSMFDHTLSVVNALCLGLPHFWLGILLILLFSLALGWLPPTGRVPLVENPAEAIRYLAMPALSLGLGVGAVMSRFVRTSMLEVLDELYVCTARSKGLPERSVVLRHALKNALIPVITVFGLQFGRLLGGAIVIESVFAWPGVGRLILQGFANRDYAVIQGALLLLVTIAVVVNLLTDLAYAYLDPRIRYS